MTDFVHDVHNIPLAGPVGATIRRHLLATHGVIASDEDSLDDLSKRHAGEHGRLGRLNPEDDSSVTLRQKAQLQAKFEAEYAISLPEWVFRHSYLSDLKSLDRLLRAAYLARPSSALNQPRTGVDNQTQA